MLCEQALEWPRQVSDCTCEIAGCSAIPLDIQMACAFLAAELSYTGKIGGASTVGAERAETAGPAPAEEGGIEGLEPFSEVVVGPISVDMKADAKFESGSSWGWDVLPPYVQSLLSKWIDGGAGMYGMSQGNVSRGSVARQSGRLPWQVPGTLSLRNGRVYPRYGNRW